MSLSVIPLTILGQITGATGSGDTVLYQVSFKSIDGTPLYGVTAVWTDEQAEIEALAAQKPYGVWINPIDGTFTVKFADYTYVGSADLTDADVLAGVTPIEFITTEVSDRLLPEVDSEDVGKTVIVNEDGEWELDDFPEELPAVTSADNGKSLQVVNGEWQATERTYLFAAMPTELNTKILTELQPFMTTIVSAPKLYQYSTAWNKVDATDVSEFERFSEEIIQIAKNPTILAYQGLRSDTITDLHLITGRYAENEGYTIKVTPFIITSSSMKFRIKFDFSTTLERNMINTLIDIEYITNLT